MLRTHPKDAIFACVLLQGEAFFYQSGRCMPVHQGDIIIYPTTLPYLYGFTRDMRQIQVDIATENLIADQRIARPTSPTKIDSTLPTGRLLTTALRTTMSDFIEKPLAADATRTAERLRALLGALLSAQEAKRPSEQSAMLRLMRAEAFIAEHLQDTTLDAAEVARHLSMSVRHLNRLFSHRDCTVTHWIWNERLRHAHVELASPGAQSAAIGEVALRWGFATQAHFASCFKAKYGITPSEHRMRNAIQ